MSDIVLSVENLWKQYRLGVVGSGSIKDDIARWWAKIRGKEDPSLKIGEANDRENIKGDYVWALQDINFEVKRGEVLGIIGKNGAGKSTLLKILSKVTTPTKGHIKTKGRIASLLEVGTGFHPELTGRENIYLNGAILGMDKNYINSRFDEIVEFSEIGKYIDTPVKRYSSGMYVRLAFAVAAHLEPEILIIDEVLAVGDAEFQKKCLGKMKDVSGEGRTVLFVSHNMTMLKSLCDKGVLLTNGMITMNSDSINTIVDTYLLKDEKTFAYKQWKIEDAPKIKEWVAIRDVQAINKKDEITETYDVKEDIFLTLEYEVFVESYAYQVHFYIKNQEGHTIFVAIDNNHNPYKESITPKGVYKEICKIPANLLNEGILYVTPLICTCPTTQHNVVVNDVLTLFISDDMKPGGVRGDWFREWPNAIIRPNFEWSFLKK